MIENRRGLLPGTAAHRRWGLSPLYWPLLKPAGAVESLTFETLVLAPLALGYMVILGARGWSHFTADGVGHTALLVLTGLVAAVPLVLFDGAAIRVLLTTLGLLQHLAR